MLDVDVGAAKDGHLSLENLESEHGKLPDTVCVETGGGGLHLIFECPEQRLKGRVGLLSGLDVKADGGYIVAPPSQHTSGRTYLFEASSSPDDLKPAPLPPWLLSLIQQPRSNGTRPTVVSHGRSLPSRQRPHSGFQGFDQLVGVDWLTQRHERTHALCLIQHGLLLAG